MLRIESFKIEHNSWLSIIIIFIIGTMIIIGCSSDIEKANKDTNDNNNDCTPGQAIECPCFNGVNGIQICRSDKTFDNCQCDNGQGESGGSGGNSNEGGSGQGGSGGSSNEGGSGQGGSGGSSNEGGSGQGGSGGSNGEGGGGDVILVDLDWAQWPIVDQPDFELQKNIVIDNGTKLVWQLELPTEKYDWEASRSYCNELSLAGNVDWRLPTLIELISIVDYSRQYPAIDISVFSSDNPETITWSSSPDAETDGKAWQVDWSTGRTVKNRTYDMYNVRCVRGGLRGVKDHYENKGEDVVLDKNTGLYWQSVISRNTYNIEEAKNYCTNWGGRIPTEKELLSIVNIKRVDPAIDVVFFPNTSFSAFFSSTQISDGFITWRVFFDDGRAFDSVSGSGPVRCVR